MHVVAMVMMLIVAWCCLLPVCRGTSVTHRDYVIVGAGPSGLQLAYFMERMNRDYLVVERNSVPGSFFQKYPRHDKLISINKRYTGHRNSELNFRHDWNGLISHLPQIRFKHYSKNFFPDKSEMLTYLKDYQKVHDIKVKYDTNVDGISHVTGKKNVKFTMRDQLGNVFTCKYLVLATGVDLPNKLSIEGADFIIDYSDASVDPQDYTDKSVLIIGNGNSAFEFGDSIVSTASYVHILGRNKIELAWETHYVGDLRAVNNALLDTYQLKSLDGILEGDVTDSKIVKLPNGKLQLYVNGGDEDNHSMRKPYDYIIGCIGFHYNHTIYKNLDTHARRSRKYPTISADHRLANNAYVIGTSSHSLDFKKSAGGFVHGFRYTTRIVHRIMEWRHHGVSWPSNTYPLSEMTTKMAVRMNSMSANYQMTRLIADVIILNSDGKTFTYLEELSSRTLGNLRSHTGHRSNKTLVIRLEYGTQIPGAAKKDVFSEDRSTGESSDGHNSNFLHPVIYYYENINNVQGKFDNSDLTMPKPEHILHLVEDFHVEFNTPKTHQQVLTGFISMILNRDNRLFYAEECALFAMTMTQLPLYCEEVMNNEVQPVSNDNIHTLFTK